MAFLSQHELSLLGFKSIGENVLISNKASIYGANKISFGSNVRIDDFCILSATGENTDFDIGNYIHIGCYTSMIGRGNIILDDFVNISSKVAIYSSNDDYSGSHMTNPMVDSKFTNVYSDSVILKRHVIIGSGSILLPGVILEKGVAIGAQSMVNRNCKEYTIYAGNPLKEIKKRKRGLLDKENEFLKKK